MINSVNHFFDAIPRVAFFRHARELPAWRSCGLAGFYVAVLAVLAAGLFTGRSMLVLGYVILVSVGSFFIYGHLRKWITGHERFVLLEHVWIALLVSWEALALAGEPALEYLDLFSIGLAIFLAGGRVGCLLAGCCFGCPASLGVAYRQEHAALGFPRYLVGVRLFPVQALEMIGLLVIAAAGLALLAERPPGTVLAWFLISYSVMRFGLEQLRGDRRPYRLTFSQAQWMSALQFGVTLLWIQGGDWTPGRLAAAVLLLVAFACVVVPGRGRNQRRRLLTHRHIEEVRASADFLQAGTGPSASRTSEGVTVAVSSAAGVGLATAHVSLSLPDGQPDFRLLCDLAHSAFSSLLPDTTTCCSSRVLHFLVPILDVGMRARTGRDEFYGAVLRSAQSRGTRPDREHPTSRESGSTVRPGRDGLNGDGRRAVPPAVPPATEVDRPGPVGHWHFRL